MTPPATPQSETLRTVDTPLFDRLFADLAPRVRGYLQRLTGGDTAEAEDLTQEVFLAAYAARDTYRRGAQPIGWLMGIARRRWRDGNRGLRLSQVEMPIEARSSQDVGEQVVCAAHLEDCLARLDPKARDAVLLVFGQGLTYAEAAQMLNEPVGTVKWRVHAASKTLRTLLRADETEELP